MTRVLHVTNCDGGGVVYALSTYIANAPEVEHYVLAPRADAPGGAYFAGASFLDLPANPAKSVRAIRRAVRSLRPDFVHAHSSIGGVLSRVSLVNRTSMPLIYTPHCYAFERTDVSRPARAAFRTAERLLARNTTTLAACADREALLSSELGHRDVRMIPNVANLGEQPDHRAHPSTQLTISAGGRLTAQKDPEFFLRLQQRLAPRVPDVRWQWIGGGDDVSADRLESAGIAVTGWLPQPESWRRLGESALYLHTAAWEGFPLAVLEAVDLGVPVLVRPIAAFAEIPRRLQVSEENLARLLADRSDPSGEAQETQKNLADWHHLLSRNTAAGQAEALRRLYSLNTRGLSERVPG